MGAVRVERSRETYVRVQGVLVRKERKASACHPPRKVYLDAHDISGSHYRRRARRVRRGMAVGAGGRAREIGRAHVCTPVTNAHLVCRLLLAKKKTTAPK